MEALVVRERTELGKSAARGFRKRGQVPCVFYGGEEPTRHLLADAKDLAAALRHGEKIVELNLEGADSHTAFVKDVQFETVTERILHVDFVRIRMDEEIAVSVPLVLRGTAKGQQQGAMVEQVAYEIEVLCLPAEVPEEVVVRVDDLDVGDIWHAGDIPVPESVKLASPADTVVVTCHMPRGVDLEEEEEEAGEAEPVRVEKERDEEAIMDEEVQQAEGKK